MTRVNIVVALIICFCTYSCKNLTTCEQIEKTELMMLVDISDKALFKNIKLDLEQNLPVFMNNSQLNNIGECQLLKVSISNLSAKNDLSIKSAQIGTNKKGLSRNEIRTKTNAKPVLILLNKALKAYDSLSKNTAYNKSSNILRTVVKSVINMSSDSENTLLLFSDLIENSSISDVNFYRNIPEKNIEHVIEKLVDPILLSEFKEKITDGMDLRVIIVQKSDQLNRLDKGKLKIFWQNCFNILGVERVQFIDDLTNNIR